MDEKDMIETEDAYYDGTRDEDTEDAADTAEEDTEEVNDSDDGDEEDYFDLDDEEEPVEEEAEEESDDDDTGEDEEDESADEESEEKGEKADKTPDNSSESELLEAVKDLLRACKIDNVENVPETVRRLTAEALGISPEEYAKRIETERAQKASWEAQMQKDIDAIHEAFPATKKYKSLKELPNKEKFAALMDDKTKNLTAVEAFAASHTDIVKAHSKAPGRNSDLKGTKDHIKSNVPKGAKDTSTYISKGEMDTYREMFPGLSDREIKKLYKTANN